MIARSRQAVKEKNLVKDVAGEVLGHGVREGLEHPPLIETISLSKRYGVRPVLRSLSLGVKAGEVYALVGPNGAGKTTVIRLITGLAFPSSGQVRLFGVDPISQPKVKSRLGAVVEAPAAFYPYMTGRNNLRLHAKLVGKVDDKRIGEVLDMLELGNASDRKVGIYSLGMRQRLGVAAAILNKPEVLILDEPASGMDPLSLHLVHRVLQQAAQDGAAVFISTHHLDEVNAYCNRVGILEEECSLTRLIWAVVATVTVSRLMMCLRP
ncbi:MAG: ABC transporter ATP-binding protein [Deinococcales bacterium]